MINLREESIMIHLLCDVLLVVLGIFIENRRPWMWGKLVTFFTWIKAHA
jgi:hypothetical protein